MVDLNPTYRLVTQDDLDDPSSDARQTISAGLVARWTPGTSYAAGASVVSPTGDLVVAKTAFTSNASYDPSNWSQPPGLTATYGAVPVGDVSEVWVSKFGSDTNSGKGPGNAVAFKTVQKAVDALTAGGGVVHIGEGTYIESVAVSKPNVWLVGPSGHTPDIGAAIKAPSDAANCITITAPACRVINVGTQGSGSTTWAGTAIKLDNAARSEIRGWRHVSRDDGDQGVGLALSRTEGALITDYSVSSTGTAVAFGDEATENVFINGQSARCARSWAMTGNGGGNFILRYKATFSRALPSDQAHVTIGGSGSNYFLGFDVDESDAAGGTRALVMSDFNTFEHCVGSPQMTWTDAGNKNIYNAHRILLSMRLTGTRIEMLAPRINGVGDLTDTGLDNLIEGLITEGTPTVSFNSTTREIRGFARRVSGRWFSGYSGTIDASTTTLNRVLYTPIDLRQRFTTGMQLGVRVESAASGATARLGLYRDNNGAPNDLIAQTAVLDLSTNGDKAAPLAFSEAQRPGRYWLAFVPQGAAATMLTAPPNAIDSEVGGDTLVTAAKSSGSRFENGITGALPSTATPQVGASNERVIVGFNLS